MMSKTEVFDEFDSQLKMAMAEAEQNGTLDKGMENYKADKVSVKENQTVHTDKLSVLKLCIISCCR